MQFHHLSTEVRQRFTTDEPHLQNVKFSDFIMDGYSLHKRLEKYDLVPSLVDGTKERVFTRFFGESLSPSYESRLLVSQMILHR